MTQCMPLHVPGIFDNFKWATGGHPDHKMTSAFISTSSSVGILHIGHITDSPVSRVEKGSSRLFIPNDFVPLFDSRNIITFHVNMWNGLSWGVGFPISVEGGGGNFPGSWYPSAYYGTGKGNPVMVGSCRWSGKHTLIYRVQPITMGSINKIGLHRGGGKPWTMIWCHYS